MSTEDSVMEALQTPVDQNAQAAEEAKRMLAELEGETADAVKSEDTNGVKKEDRADSLVFSRKTAKEGDKYDDEEDDARERRQDRGGRREYNDRGRGRGRGGRGRGRDDRNDRYDRNGNSGRNYRDNIKSDLTTQELTDDPAAIRKQVHFYFSDSNLPKDKFLFGLTGGIENKPVELKKLHTFKRMEHFQPFDAIVKALKDSDFVELTDDDTGVRRREPLPENFFKVITNVADPRTVYVKGFGQESPSTQFDIEAFFDPYGPTKAVRLRRNDEKHFKGSVFVEFETEDLAKAFLNLDPKPEYKDRELQILAKTEYQDKKSDDLRAGKITSNSDGRRKGGDRGERREHRGSPDYSKGGKRDHDDRDWRTRRDEDQKRGFRDNNGRGDRRGRDGKGYGGGRSKAPDTDEQGIPSVKSTLKDDPARDEALAKAKAAVEADIKKEEGEQKAANDVESTEQNGNADASTKTTNAVADSIKDEVEAVAGKKRAREEEDEVEERDIKKVDTKTEPEPVKTES